jgi:hypothetical protein
MNFRKFITEKCFNYTQGFSNLLINDREKKSYNVIVYFQTHSF